MRNTYTNEIAENTTYTDGGKRVQHGPVEGRRVRKAAGTPTRHQRRRNVQQVVCAVAFLLSLICMFAYFGSYVDGYEAIDVLPGVVFCIVVCFFSGTRIGIFTW